MPAEDKGTQTPAQEPASTEKTEVVSNESTTKEEAASKEPEATGKKEEVPAKKEETKTEDKKQEEKKEEKEPEKSILDTEVEDEEDKDKKEEGAEDKDEADPVPDKYEFVAPEGVELDQGLLGKFETVAKELGIGNKAAQKIMETAALHSKEVMEAQQAKDAEIIAGFKKEITDDPKSRQIRLDAQLAVKTFGADNESFKELTGQWVGNHPGLVRFLAKIGNQLREADHISSDGAGGEDTPKTRGQIMYPSMDKKK